MRSRAVAVSLAVALGALALAAPAARSSAQAPPSGCRALNPALPWYGDNRERLQVLIYEHGRCSAGYDRERPPLAIFDWDNTVVRNDVGDALLFWMLRHSRILQPGDWKRTSPYLTDAAAAALQAACGTAVPAGRPLPTRTDAACADEIVTTYLTAATTGGAPAFAGWNRRRLEPTYAWVAHLLAGWKRHQVRAFARAARAQNLAAEEGRTQTVGTRQVTGWVRYYAQIRDLVRAMRWSGFDVWIVSASPQWVVEEWAAGVGVAPNRIIGIRSVTDAAGRATYDLQGCGEVADGADSVITYIEGKRCWINQEILGIEGAQAFAPAPESLRQVFGAGDSTTDITFLRDATDLRLVINRGRAELMCQAYNNADGGWIINPQFIRPRPKAAAPYPCSTTAYVDEAGTPGPVLDDAGNVIPDQEDTVHP